MEDRSLDKALDIYSILATGRSISQDDRDTADLYSAYYADSEVYDITNRLLQRLNLKLYESKDSLYVTAGSGNKVFGYTNDDLKRMMGLKLNRELYLVYYIIYQILVTFYKDSDSYQIRDYVRIDEIIEAVSRELGVISEGIPAYTDEDINDNSFKSIAILWDGLPPMISEDKDRNKASRGSRMGYVKLAFNLLIDEKVFMTVDDRFYPTGRFHAIAENYFEDNRSAIYAALKGGDENA